MKIYNINTKEVNSISPIYYIPRKKYKMISNNPKEAQERLQRDLTWEVNRNKESEFGKFIGKLPESVQFIYAVLMFAGLFFFYQWLIK